MVLLLLATAVLAGCVDPLGPGNPGGPLRSYDYRYGLSVVACYPATDAIVVVNKRPVDSGWTTSFVNVTDAGNQPVGHDPWNTSAPAMLRPNGTGTEALWTTGANLTAGRYTARFQTNWNPHVRTNVTFRCEPLNPQNTTPDTTWTIGCHLPSFDVTLRSANHPIQADQLLVTYQPPGSGNPVMAGTNATGTNPIGPGYTLPYHHEGWQLKNGTTYGFRVVYAPTGATIVSEDVTCR